MEAKQAIERITKLTQKEIGPTEENVKQKVIVPMLELLGHNRDSLQFEYRTKSGGVMDIFINDVPGDCKVIIDTKNYRVDLDDYVEQIRQYTFDENALLSVLANGTEIRIYSPLKGVAFQRSLLYSFKRQDLASQHVWGKLSDLLHKDNLQNRVVLGKIEEREREIRNALATEESLRQKCDTELASIDRDIDSEEEEIRQLKEEKDRLAGELKAKTSEIWAELDLPMAFHETLAAVPSGGVIGIRLPPPVPPPARRVRLQELVDEGLLRDKQALYFHHSRVLEGEEAEVVVQSNKLRYRADGVLYSVSALAKYLLVKHQVTRSKHGFQGPKYWITEGGKLLHDLNEQIRARRGDRK